MTGFDNVIEISKFLKSYYSCLFWPIIHNFAEVIQLNQLNILLNAYSRLSLWFKVTQIALLAEMNLIWFARINIILTFLLLFHLLCHLSRNVHHFHS